MRIEVNFLALSSNHMLNLRFRTCGACGLRFSYIACPTHIVDDASYFIVGQACVCGAACAGSHSIYAIEGT